MTDEASTTTWETLVEQYRDRAARDDARIDELRQSTKHWHDTAEMLMRQRNIAEEERDGWKIRAMQSEQQRQSLRKDRDQAAAVVETAKVMADFIGQPPTTNSYGEWVAAKNGLLAAVATLRELESA
jgi:hypothetical protein